MSSSIALPLPPLLGKQIRRKRSTSTAALALIASSALIIAGQGAASLSASSPAAVANVATPRLATDPTRYTAADGIAGLLSLPLVLQIPLHRSLGEKNKAYAIASSNGVLRATSPTYGFTTTFTHAGPQVSAAGHSLGMGLAEIGRGGHLAPVADAKPEKATVNSVVYDRGIVSEENTNGPMGLAQKFVVPHSPAIGSAPLTLALDSSGGLTPEISKDKLSATFTQQGKPVFGYRGLMVADATGAKLPAWFSATDGRLAIQVDDRHATYPVTVDPFINLAKTGMPYNGFGYSVAVEHSPSQVTENRKIWIAIGDPTADEGGIMWTYAANEDGSELDVYDEVLSSNPGSRLGHSIDIAVTAVWSTWNTPDCYVDVATVVAGAPNYDFGHTDAGVLMMRKVRYWTLTFISMNWLMSRDARDGDNLGNSVAISADASTVVAGATGYKGPNGNMPNAGSALVFKSTDNWGYSYVQNSQTLVASSPAPGDLLGSAVDVSANGKVVVVGARQDDNASGKTNDGSANVYREPGGSGWLSPAGMISPAAHLSASGAKSNDEFGGAVAISGNSYSVVVGARGVDLTSIDQGAAFVYNSTNTRTGNLFQDALLRKGTGTGFVDQFGFSVAISYSGYDILVGARFAEDSSGTGFFYDEGAIFRFTSPSGINWYGTVSNYVQRLSSFSEATSGAFGTAAAISSDGTIAVGSAPSKNDNTSEVDIFKLSN